MTSDMLERKSYPRSNVLVFPVLPIDRQPGLSNLVIFYFGPVVLAILTANCPPQVEFITKGILLWCGGLWSSGV